MAINAMPGSPLLPSSTDRAAYNQFSAIITKINELIDIVNTLKDETVAELSTDLTTLSASVETLSTTSGTHTTDIAALDVRVTALESV